MPTVYLAFGTNRGDRLANLHAALQKLEAGGVRIEAKSKIYQTQSVEGGGEGDFLNAAARAHWEGNVPDLLALCQRIEVEMGREPPPRNGPRTLDIDILSFGDEVWDTPEIQLPHPRQHLRAFVLQPLLDVLEGGWVEPTDAIW